MIHVEQSRSATPDEFPKTLFPLDQWQTAKILARDPERIEHE
jgi:hypothetical protein